MVALAFEWRHLLFANWPVDAAVVDDHLPDAFDVDEYDGRAWLSVIPFVNANLRARSLPREAGVTLPELNLRTYVTCEGEPGIYFFSLDLQSVIGTAGARLTHHLPYFYARTRFEWDDGQGWLTSRRRHPGAPPVRFSARYGPDGDAYTPEPGSLDAFLTERRRLYTQDGRGRVRYTDVDHEHWTLSPASATLDCEELFAASRFDVPDAEPTLYYSPGVAVTTTSSKRWRDRPRPAPPRDRRVRSSAEG